MSAGRRAARAIAAWLADPASAWPITAEKVAAFEAPPLATPLESLLDTAPVA